MTSCPQKNRGFTLIEMLVTLTLMALLSVLSWRALDVMDRSYWQVRASAQDTTAMSRVLDQLQTDISGYALLETPFPSASGQLLELDAAALPAAIQWNGTTLSIIQPRGNGDFANIVWHRDGNQLQRFVSAASGHFTMPPRDPSRTILHRIETFNVLAWIPGRGWFEPRSVPAGLRATGLNIEIQRVHKGRTQNFHKVILLP